MPKAVWAMPAEKGGDIMSVPIEEQETVVQFDRTSDNMSIYTSDRRYITKLDKIYKRSREFKYNGKVEAVEYIVPVRLLTFRKATKKKPINEELRKERSERLKAMRKAQSNFDSSTEK